jgi:hypothetical protein
MHHIQDGAQSLSLLLKLNLDRIMFLGALGLALALGGYVGTL